MAVPFAKPTEESILELIQEAAEGIKQPAPTTLNSQSREVKMWIRAANWTGRDLRRAFPWPALLKRYLFTTTEAVSLYPLPVDFDKSLFDTFWQKTQFSQALGPMSAREWEARKNGLVSTSPYMQYRLIDDGDKQIELLDAPSAGEDIVFQYQSSNWILPTFEWRDGIGVVIGEYCHYKGNVYRATNVGSTGAVAPVHQSGIVTDGVVLWEYSKYEKVVEDGAKSLMDSTLMILGMQAFWLSRNGFDYEAIASQYKAEMGKRIGALTGAQTFLAANAGVQGNSFFGWRNFPQTGYGDEE